MTKNTKDRKIHKIGLSGSCHWCMEAIFQSLIGVHRVEQGWLSEQKAPTKNYEGILVHFDPIQLSIHLLISVHLYSHSCTSIHAMRSKYKSAIYVFNEVQRMESTHSINTLASEFDSPIITEVVLFNSFELNKEVYLNYYQKNPNKPFCQTYIEPKLKLILSKFSSSVTNYKTDDT